MPHQERKHARLSASSAERWIACTGSVALIESIPKTAVQPRSPYADRGTALHQLSEQIILESIEPFPGMAIEVAPGVVYNIDDEDLDGVLYYVQFLDLVKDECVDWRMEVSLPMDHIHPDLGGTADFIGVTTKGMLYVVDLKTGRGKVVAAVGNTQALQYAVGAYEALDETTRSLVTTVRMVIFQPYNAATNPITYWDMPVEYLQTHKDLLSRTATEVNESPTLNPGEWCRFCPALAFCPAKKAEFGDLVTYKEQLPVAEQLTPEDMGRILALWEYLEPWVKSIYSVALQLAEKGIHIPHMKLVPKRAVYRWEDVNRALAVLVGEGYNKRDLVNIELKSPAQMKKVVPRDLVESLVVRLDRGVNLVLDTDSVKGPDLTPQLPNANDLGLDT